MTATQITSEAVNTPRTLTLDVDVDRLGKYASLMALGSAVLAGSGILSVVAYMSAWDVPAPLIRLDPLTAALRSETVIYQVAVLAAIVFGLDALARRLPDRRVAIGLATGGAAIVTGYLVVDLVLGGYLGPAITVVGGVALFVGHRRGLVGPRSTAVLFAVIALLAAYQTGAESGRLIRDDPTWQTPLTLTSRTPIGGLDGGIATGDAWRYSGLYLVFRDGEAVYVSRSGRGSAVWIVPAAHVMAIGMGGG